MYLLTQTHTSAFCIAQALCFYLKPNPLSVFCLRLAIGW